MTEERFELFQEFTGKARDARMAKWSAMENVFGFIIGSASIVSALKAPTWYLLSPLLLSGFIGVVMTLRCFTLLHRGYTVLAQSYARDDHRTDEQKTHDAIQSFSVPEPINKAERWALLCLWVCAGFYAANIVHLLLRKS